MSTVHVWIEGSVARTDTGFLNPGDTVIVKAYQPYEDMAGEGIVVPGHHYCHGCKIYDCTCNLTCHVPCGACIIKDPSDILEGI